MKAGKTFKGTWLNRAGESTEYRATKDGSGPRVVVHRWMDTNEVEVRAITGDGRKKAGLTEFTKLTLQNPTSAELELAVDTCAKSLPQ